jgi:hypothetical protein
MAIHTRKRDNANKIIGRRPGHPEATDLHSGGPVTICSHVVTRFFVPDWSAADYYMNDEITQQIADYVTFARQRFGLSDGEIAEDVEAQWPSVMPGGAAVRTVADIIWVTSANFIQGNA